MVLTLHQKKKATILALFRLLGQEPKFIKYAEAKETEGQDKAT